jgi:hypothetical protein
MMHLVNLLQPGSYSVKPATKPSVSQVVPKQTKPPSRGFETQSHAINEHPPAGDAVREERTSHEPDREPCALDEARAERVEAAGRLVRARRGQDPPERRGGRLPHVDAAGSLLGGEVRAAGGHIRWRRRPETVESRRRGVVGAAGESWSGMGMCGWLLVSDDQAAC